MKISVAAILILSVLLMKHGFRVERQRQLFANWYVVNVRLDFDEASEGAVAEESGDRQKAS